MEILAIIIKVLIYLTIVGTGLSLYSLYQKKCNDERVKRLVKTTVKYVEQVFYSEPGEVKLNEALRKLSLILAGRNISISTEELEVLIEEAVMDCKELFNQNKETDVRVEGFKEVE